MYLYPVHDKAPRIKRDKYGWYIVYFAWNPTTKKFERKREKRDINRIKDITMREKYAQVVRDDIDERLPHGYPFRSTNHIYMSLEKAIQKASEIKQKTDRDRTRQMYIFQVKNFCWWATREGYINIDVRDFSKNHCQEYLDYAANERLIGNVTYNNYIKAMKSLFSEMQYRGWILKNPWNGIKEKKEYYKRRRAFTEFEVSIILPAIRTLDPLLFLAVLLIYFCFIRPEELRFLRPHFFDFQRGTINLSGAFTKNRSDASVTMPKNLTKLILDLIKDIPPTHLIFGENGESHPTKMIGRNTLNFRHASILRKLRKDEILSDVTGLSLYSWKDTGAQRLVKSVDIDTARRQLRHADLNTTQRYLKQISTVLPEIRDYEDPILKKYL